MFANNLYPRFMACVAAFGMMTAPIFGATPISANPELKHSTEPLVVDVKLEKGQLTGQILSPSGKPGGSQPINLMMENETIAKTKSDALGRFAIPVQTSGVYQVAVAGDAFTVRAWRPEMAPPAAKTGLLCVTQAPTVRGQLGYGGPVLMSILTNPVVLGLGIAAAIAVPVALNDDDDHDAS